MFYGNGSFHFLYLRIPPWVAFFFVKWKMLIRPNLMEIKLKKRHNTMVCEDILSPGAKIDNLADHADWKFSKIVIFINVTDFSNVSNISCPKCPSLLRRRLLHFGIFIFAFTFWNFHICTKTIPTWRHDLYLYLL